MFHSFLKNNYMVYSYNVIRKIFEFILIPLILILTGVFMGWQHSNKLLKTNNQLHLNYNYLRKG
jgi:hypothetical protein